MIEERGMGLPPRTDRETGSVLVFALIVMFLLSFLGLTLLTVAATEHSLALNAVWYDGALAAAEAGLNQGMDQLSPNAVSSTQAIAVTSLAQNSFRFRSGRRTDAGPQPLTFVEEHSASGYAMGAGTGYNAGGYVFRTYQINATGIGPRDTIMREVEARVDLGPVPK